MKTRNLLLFTIGACVLLISACRGPETDPTAQFLEQLKIDTTTIGAYARANALDMRKTADGIFFRVTRMGTGLPPKAESNVEVSYTGRLLDGSVFDTGSIDGPMSGFIPGFNAALQLLPVGSSAIVIIPSVYAYGQTGNASIPPNACLLFDMSLEKINPTSEELTQLYSDTTKIRDFLNLNNITGTIKDPSGLRYKVTSFGSGSNANWYDPVKISYTGRLLSNGETIVIGTSEPAVNFDSWVVNYMPAFQIGLRKINPGGSITLYTPSGLAYGPRLVSSGKKVIPANSVMIFELTLDEIPN